MAAAEFSVKVSGAAAAERSPLRWPPPLAPLLVEWYKMAAAGGAGRGCSPLPLGHLEIPGFCSPSRAGPGEAVCSLR